MTPQKRQMMLIGVMLVMLAFFALSNVNWMFEQRELTRRAFVDWTRCSDIAEEINALRGKPAVASTAVMGIQELGKQIEAASKKSRFNGPLLQGVFPQPSRRIGDSVYLEKPTMLSLRGISLWQLGTFLYHLTEDSHLIVRELRLRSPHNDKAKDVWDAEAKLVYFVYSTAAKKSRVH